MSAAPTLLPPQAIYTNEAIYKLSVDQYHDLINKGTLTENDPVELIEGVLVFKMPKNTPHATAVRRCRRSLEAQLPMHYFYDAENPITLSDGEPEPDGVVVSGTIDDYEHAHPAPAQVALVIEVSDSTLDRDRGIKLRSYARAGIFCYWIVNLIDRQIEVYSQPDATALSATYLTSQIFKSGESFPLYIGEQAAVMIPVSDLLPIG